jgi:hypothetical protein
MVVRYVTSYVRSSLRLLLQEIRKRTPADSLFLTPFCG